ncbi:hypothetical protein N665_1107s0018, partial [Sinapis alba]
SHHKTKTSSKHSEWLHSTIAELDSTTNAMLSLIDEGNADSFAQRAETYYKKRPELITFVHDFYRAHRSLAHRFHHLKASSSSIDHSLSELLDDDPHSEIDDDDHQDQGNNASSTLKLEQEREVIRQLSLTVETLKDDNLSLKRRLRRLSLKKRSSVFHLYDMFLGNLFCIGNAPSW